MTEKENKVVNLFGGQNHTNVGQDELDEKLSTLFKEQNNFVNELLVASYRTINDIADQQDEVEPLVHIPIEASFSLASSILSVASGRTEEEAKQLYPHVQELSNAIDKTVDEFYTKYGDQLPNEIMYYGLINVALNALRHERNIQNYVSITGQSPFQGGHN